MRYPGISSKDIRVHLAIVEIVLLMALYALIGQAGQIKQSAGEYPTLYVLILLAHIFVFLMLLILILFASRFKERISHIIGWMNKTGYVAVIILGILAISLLFVQIELWLLPDSRLARTSIALADLFVVLFLVRCFFRQSDILGKLLSGGQKARRKGLTGLLRYQDESLPYTSLIIFIIVARLLVSGYFVFFAPLQCDEAATYELFGQSIFASLARYDIPNNHLLNSFLIFLFTQVFGSKEWVIRLPAFLADIAALVTVYVFARTLFNRHTAVLSLALVSICPWLLYYSSQARGYPLINLFSLVAVLNLVLTMKSQSPGFAWSGYVASLTLAFATMPTACYIWVSLLVLGVVAYLLRGRTRASINKTWGNHFFISQGTVLVCTAMIYLNPLYFRFRNGVLFENFSYPFQPQSTFELFSCFANLAVGGEVGNPSSIFTVSPACGYLIGFFLSFGLLYGTLSLVKSRRLDALLLFGCLIFTPLFIIVLQSNIPFPRNFLYLVPFLYILAAYGLAEFYKLFYEKLLFQTRHQHFAFCVYAGIIFLICFIPSVNNLNQYLMEYHSRWPAKEIAQYLESNARSEDYILADFCLAYPIEYYISPKFHVTSDLEWQVPDSQNANRIFIIPFMRKSGSSPGCVDAFLTDICKGHGVPMNVTHIGKQDIYLCARP